MSPWDRNQAWAKPGPYITKLSPDDERQFQQWVIDNKIPFDPSDEADYDMRGYWQEQQGTGDQRQVNPNDGQPHFPDTYKTPYHESFSNESRYATPSAPRWNNLDQLVLPNGTVVFDERNRQHQVPQRGAP